MQLAQPLDRRVLRGREPGVVRDQAVAVGAYFEGEQGEELVQEGRGEGFV